MKAMSLLLFSALLITSAPKAFSQNDDLRVPKTVEAGRAFSIQTSGSGQSTLYILGPDQALKRDVQLGQSIEIAAGTLYNAGHYVALLGEGATSGVEFDLIPAGNPADLSFLARPSRLPVSIRAGITGAVYVFDRYHNLISAPTRVQFELTTPSSGTQTRSAVTRHGAVWSEFDSSAQQGADKFVATAGDASSMRVIRQVPGDPCALRMSANQVGKRLQLTTDPVRDCSGNAVPDGTIVTFTQNYGGQESTVDVPLKRGIAEVQMPSHPGATISVASGVVLGNQIRWAR